ncbi:MAG: organomercurial transporter MerC [Gammaproteobacteria bacterium]|nr:organomercurial transporter MerC [Gammaproteobacteria bacterium]
MQLHKLLDNSGSLGAIISTMGCASCFPAAASLGAAAGLGFLSAYEGLFINTLLPLFAVLSLLLQLYSGWVFRRYIQLIFGASGPLMVLATLYLFWSDDWSTYLLYSGLVLMMLVSVWQWLLPVCVSQPQKAAS